MNHVVPPISEISRIRVRLWHKDETGLYFDLSLEDCASSQDKVAKVLKALEDSGFQEFLARCQKSVQP